MAKLHFNNDHYKVAYLLKPTESLSFHQIIDFMNGLYIRYALTANLTIYASLVRQFWGSASEVSLPDGVKGLVATIDGTAYTVTEASIRSTLQLDDLNAINTMTNEETFARLRNIGYTIEGKFTFFKNKFSPQWKFLIHTLIHCLSPKSGEPAFVQAQQQDVAQPPPSHVVAPHPSPDPMPLPPRPSELVLETITSPLGDDDTGGGSCHESPPRPLLATPTRSPTVGVTEEPLRKSSLPLDPKTEELDEPLRISLRKKSIARKRTLPSPSKPKSDALPFDEDDPEAAFKSLLNQLNPTA
nr:xylulose kinase-1 [Tanacetum cinerariifolium]